MPGCGDPVAAEARAIGAMCGGVRIWSLYVPNGRKVDDPHYVYKLDWLAPARATRARLARATTRALVGDWNIAPTDEDVFDMAAVREGHARDPAGAGRVPGLPRRRLRRRGPPAHAGPEVYTYWDYYRQRFERNRGMRIDFVLGSPALADAGDRRVHRPRRAGRDRAPRPRAGDRRPGLTASVERSSRLERHRRPVCGPRRPSLVGLGPSTALALLSACSRGGGAPRRARAHAAALVDQATR